MIVKKLAAPLINEKILQQAEHCYIATTAVSEPAFDFIRTRLPPKCKIEIVTGLDGITSPEVLRKTWRHYHDRITIRIYSRNLFHANVYIFDLPYRKAVAFIGSGDLTTGGIKDNEEIFYKVTEPKEIEALKSWFTGYYEFSETLTEDLLQEYDWIYPSLRQREIASREEKQQVMDLTTRGLSWDSIKFKNQYFKKEDYFTFSNSKVSLNTAELQAERMVVRNKLSQLCALIKEHFADLDLYEHPEASRCISSTDPADHPDQKLRSMAISFGSNKGDLSGNSLYRKHGNFLCLQIFITQRETGIRLVIGKPAENGEEREFFRDQMAAEPYRDTFFNMMQGLGGGYWIGVNGEKKAIDVFQNKDTFWEFTRSDDWRFASFLFGRNYLPGDPAISNENIASTFMKDADKLVPIYRNFMEKRG